MHFPIRGHSYLECDKDMALIKQSTPCELPSEWANVFAGARKNPLPYNVIKVPQDMILAIGTALKPQFRATCPIPTRSVRELKVEIETPANLRI